MPFESETIANAFHLSPTVGHTVVLLCVQTLGPPDLSLPSSIADQEEENLHLLDHPTPYHLTLIALSAISPSESHSIEPTR